MREKRFRVLFIYPNIHSNCAFSPAIQILSSILKNNGYLVDCIHVNKWITPYKKSNIINKFNKKRYNLVCVSSISSEFNDANIIAKWIKEENKDIPIIMGGIHAIIKPNDLWDSYFDAFCIGEGERVLLELVEKMKINKNYYKTKSFWFKKGENRIKNELSILTNIEDIPLRDLDILDIKKILSKTSGWYAISFSRGCPYNCSFCINPLLRKIYNVNLKEFIRMTSVKKSINELENVVNKFGKYIKVFSFNDDLLTIHKNWISEFCREYKRKIYDKFNIKFAILTRADSLNENMIKTLKESGCQEIAIGVETGNDKLRNDILNKNISKEEIINLFKLCKKYNLNTLAYIMIGIPGENKETILDTLNLLNKIKPRLIRISFLNPEYGSEMYNYCIENNIYKSKYIIGTPLLNTPLKLKNISSYELLKYRIMLPWYLNLFNNNPIYLDAINKFESSTYDELLEKFDYIVEYDKKFSKNISIPHFEFFKNNKYYCYYNEGNND